MSAEQIETLYDAARRHGLSHDAALEVLAEGELRCWCGHEPPCSGGAQRFVGCVTSWSLESIPLNFTHRRHKGDVA